MSFMGEEYGRRRGMKRGRRRRERLVREEGGEFGE